MFSGIITDVGRVRRLSRGSQADGGIELTIATAYDSAAIALGASIACSGPCLTVVAVEPGGFTVQASAETLACSTLGEWTEGTPVNLERALRLGDELDADGAAVRFQLHLLEDIAADQPENAARCAELECGLTVDSEHRTPEAI